MQTSAYDASVGHTMGSVVNVSTASGTGQLHGEAHWFLRHKVLDAPNFSLPGQPLAPLARPLNPVR